MIREEQIRVKLANVSQKLYREGLTSGSSGNISARIPEENLCLIKPSGYCLADLKPEDFLVVNIQDRSILKGKKEPSIETPFHTYIYCTREDIGSIIHVHAHFATVLSLTGKSIVPYTTDIFESPSLARGISYADFALPGTEELAQNLTKALRSCDVAIMPYHGITSIGDTPESAAKKAIVLERMAKLQYHAMLLEEPLSIPQELIKHIKKLKNRC